LLLNHPAHFRDHQGHAVLLQNVYNLKPRRPGQAFASPDVMDMRQNTSRTNFKAETFGPFTSRSARPLENMNLHFASRPPG
jgi:hypothetical protein